LNSASIALPEMSITQMCSALGASRIKVAPAWAITSRPSSSRARPANSSASTTFTAGPAMAMSSSWVGVFGRSPSMATPPMGVSVMSVTGMP
jgi:hypothetical protein